MPEPLPCPCGAPPDPRESFEFAEGEWLCVACQRRRWGLDEETEMEDA